MPTTHTVGKPSAANDKIGGIPVVHYLDFFSKGRGQVPRLLFIDAGIAYTDIRYSADEFAEMKPKFRKGPDGLNPLGTIPVIELNGQILTQSYPILRHFSRILENKYDGDTEEEMFFVDRLCDITIDWRSKFVDAYFSANQKEDYDAHVKDVRGNYGFALERHLNESALAKRGPYVIGEKFTYADMVIFQVLHDEEMGKGDQKALEEYPRLKKLYNAVQGRPNVKTFLESDEYKG